MDKRFHNALDKVYAEDELKQKTSDYLQGEIKKRNRKKKRPFLRLAVAVAATLLIFTAGGSFYRVYTTPAVYLDMDVNPSVSLTINRFGRVLKASSYNNEGTIILSEKSVRNMDYEQAIQSLLESIIADGYLAQDGLVAVTVQSEDGRADDNMLSGIQNKVFAVVDNHHVNAQCDVFAVSEEIREQAKSHHVTPAKYLSILELQEVDSTATIEGCAKHSIREIRELTKKHESSHSEQEGGHHGNKH